MKIAFFLPDLYGGGAERVMVLLANELSKKHKVYLILVRKFGDLFALVDDRVEIVILNQKSVYRSLFGFYKVLKKIKPDIVISALDTANFLNIVVTKLLKIKNIITVHNFLSKKYENNIIMKLLIKFFKYADKVISVSYGVQKDLLKYNIKSDVIYNPVLEKLHFSRKDKIIVSIGRLERVKGFKILIDAFNKLDKKEYKLYILGQGSLEKELKEYAKNNKNIIFTGFTNPDKYLKKASLFVSSSFSESFGLTIVESLGYGVDVVATCTDGAREILENGKYGLLVPVGNSQALYKAIKWRLKNLNDQEYLHQRAEDFLISKITAEYEKKIIEVLNDNFN